MITQIEAKFIAELPPLPPKPLGVFKAVSFYTGRGCRVKGGLWRLHAQNFMSQEAATEFLKKLDNYHKHRRVYYLK